MKHVFVYGTLLRGEPNHSVLASAKFIRAAQTVPAFRLVNLGAFPGLVWGGETAVHGEVWEVDDVTLSRLDRLEGHPTLFQRSAIVLADGVCIDAYLYPARNLRSAPEIPSGSWRKHRRGERK